MTTVYDVVRLRENVASAKLLGLTLKDDRDGLVAVCVEQSQAGNFPGMIDGVVIYRAPSVEDALRFVEGVRWHRFYLQRFAYVNRD